MSNDITPEVAPEPIVLKAKLSRRALVIGSAAAGALSVVLLSALTRKRQPELIVIESTDSETTED